MRKVFAIIVAVLISSIGYAQYSYSAFVPIVKGLTRAWNPQLSIAEMNYQDTSFVYVYLYSVSTFGYELYDANSRILFKFTDGEVYTLRRVVEFDVVKEYNLVKISDVWLNKYQTYTLYNAPVEFLNKLWDDVGITKIRIGYANGSNKDFEIKPKYQKKLTQLLKNASISTVLENVVRKHNMTDEDF